ncbi:MAG: guanylate kinase [Desulfosalsimonadaceae bacterium]
MSEPHPDARPKGKLFIVSAPSGAGKTTLCNALRKRFPALAYSVSHTTRAPRKNETDGQDYFFISKERFEEKIKKGEWAEWAQVHGNYYGTCAGQLHELLAAGRHVLLDIDVAGATQIKALFPQSIAVFIMPPSIEDLERRLRSRGTDSDEEIRKRIAHAHKEIAGKDFYDHVVVNDRLEEAIEALSGLIRKYTDGKGSVERH